MSSKQAQGLGHEREGCSLGTTVPIACACPPPSSAAPAQPRGPRATLRRRFVTQPRAPTGSRIQPCVLVGGFAYCLCPHGLLFLGLLHIKTLLHKYIYIYLLYIYCPGSMHGQAEGSAVLLEVQPQLQRCSPASRETTRAEEGEGGQTPAPPPRGGPAAALTWSDAGKNHSGLCPHAPARHRQRKGDGALHSWRWPWLGSGDRQDPTGELDMS